jgi:hypothetical protein
LPAPRTFHSPLSGTPTRTFDCRRRYRFCPRYSVVDTENGATYAADLHTWCLWTTSTRSSTRWQPSVSDAWTAMRTRSGVGIGHCSALNARWIAQAAATAADALGKTAKRLSPSPRGRTTVPSCSATSPSINSSCRARAVRMPSGYISTDAYLPRHR